MEKKQNPINNPDMISILEQLKHDINADIERRKLAYIGKDGKEYYDKESLDVANKLYVESMYKFIGRDGQQYSTTEQLRAADKRYEETMFPKIEKENLYYSNPDIPRENLYYNNPDISSKTR